jgi:hypothetical protein
VVLQDNKIGPALAKDFKAPLAQANKIGPKELKAPLALQDNKTGLHLARDLKAPLAQDNKTGPHLAKDLKVPLALANKIGPKELKAPLALANKIGLHLAKDLKAPLAQDNKIGLRDLKDPLDLANKIGPKVNNLKIFQLVAPLAKNTKLAEDKKDSLTVLPDRTTLIPNIKWALRDRISQVLQDRNTMVMLALKGLLAMVHLVERIPLNKIGPVLI